MSVRGRALSLSVLGVSMLVASTSAAQTPPQTAPQTGPPPAPRMVEQVRKRTPAIDPASTLLQLQTIIGRMAVSAELVPADVQELMETLAHARGRAITDPALKALATHMALGVAQGSWDEEAIERLAQDLFAGVNSRALSSREAGLLVVDVSTLLGDAGAEPIAIEAVVAAFHAISPAGVDRHESPTAARAGLAVLTRR